MGVSAFAAKAQSKTSDLALIAGVTKHVQEEAAPKKPLKPVLKYNPVYWALNGSLTFYQKVISPQISAGCLYETSCSRFSRKALQEYGIIKGVALTADRLSRCNRISAAGISRDRFSAGGKVVDEPSMYRFK
ncbi:membrane protein insertion efficiency factor YidD [Rhodocytophaga rosea]|uniref:Membrane protein insertion efficiency factor YidD n=2 Tax=Rhodocytophaga rosea TaxID=2704465 RepID=A0A6C0GVE4_9BACT|nr:membrane protein insertion efficiency factor YidD [Rhodocytophaga rosea]